MDLDGISTEELIVPVTGSYEILPDCRLKQSKKVVMGGSGAFRLNWVPIFCANCGSDGGLVPEENCNFAFYLCINCEEKHGNIEGTLMVPDDVFWATVRAEQQEQFGRELTAPELVEVLKDDSTTLAKLAKDRPTRGGN